MRRSNLLRSWCLVALLTLPVAAWGGEAGKLKILLLGDSTTIGSVCRQADPDGPHLEDVIRLLLAAEKDLPPSEVINQGRDGEYIRGLLSSGRYDKEIAPLGGVDYVLIRYGLNDVAKREEFEVNFPKDYAELIGRLRRDFPRATIVPMTIIPYMTPERDEAINALIRKVAESERLALFDVYTRYRAELSHGPNMLNYRRYPLEKVPERHREWVKPFVRGGQVVVMDNRLDAHFRELPGWFGDRHPNLAGYHVIGDESARFLAKLIREKKTTGAEVTPGGPAKTPGTGLEFIDTSFENASPLWYETAADGTILVHLVYDHERSSPNRAAGHFHFRLHASPGSTLTLEFKNLDNVWNGRKASVADELKAAVVSPDGRAWKSVPLERLPGDRVRLTVVMPGPELYVARVEPYRLSDLEKWLESIEGHPLVEITPIGKTVEGRGLEILRVGRPDAPYRVFLRRGAPLGARRQLGRPGPGRPAAEGRRRGDEVPREVLRLRAADGQQGRRRPRPDALQPAGQGPEPQLGQARRPAARAGEPRPGDLAGGDDPAREAPAPGAGAAQRRERSAPRQPAARGRAGAIPGPHEDAGGAAPRAHVVHRGEHERGHSGTPGHSAKAGWSVTASTRPSTSSTSTGSPA